MSPIMKQSDAFRFVFLCTYRILPLLHFSVSLSPSESKKSGHDMFVANLTQAR